MFNFLKGGKNIVTISLDRPCYIPGDTAQITASLQNQNELKIKKAIIEVKCKEEYQYRQERVHTSGDSHATEYETKWASSDWTVQKTEFLGETIFPAGSTNTYKFPVMIPPEAKPTCDGAVIIKVKWQTSISFEQNLILSVNDKKDIIITAPAPAEPTPGGELGVSDHPDDVDLSIKINSRDIIAGEGLSGEFFIHPHKDIDAAEIKVELIKNEKTLQGQSGNLSYAVELLGAVLNAPNRSSQGIEHSETIPLRLMGKTKLIANQVQRLPFKLDIPLPKPPSIHSDFYSIDYYIKGVIGRGFMQKSFTTQELVNMYTGRIVKMDTCS